VTVLLPNRYSNDGATGFEPRVAVYLLPYPASVGSTEVTLDQWTSV